FNSPLGTINAGIIDQDGQLRHLLTGMPHDRGTALRIGDVAAHAPNLLARQVHQGRELLLHLAQPLLAASNEEHAGPRAHEGSGNGLAQPLVRTCDDGGAVAEVHEYAVLSVIRLEWATELRSLDGTRF